MVLVLCHGQPKSGSTFVSFTVQRLSNHINGRNYWELLEDLGIGKSFQPTLDAEELRDLSDATDDWFVPLKTHFQLEEPVRQMIEDRQIAAVTSFRDPRDVCLASLDAGRREREKGETRYFHRFEKIEDVTPVVKATTLKVQGWIDCENVLSIPHYLTANAHDHMVRGLCRHFGQEHHWQAVAAEMQASKSNVPEYNKAKSDRFLHDLTKEQIAFCQSRLADQLKQYQVNLDRVMALWGCSELNAALCEARDNALREMGLPPVAAG